MLKFIKHNLSSIDGVEIYPIISLVLFFLVFITMAFFVIKLPKRKIDSISQLPLDDNNNKDLNHE
jgi:hypothetical protein